MKIRLIHPTMLDENGKPKKYVKLNMMSLTLPTIASLTPDDVEVDIIYEAVETLNFDEKVDLVGITALTNHAPRAYQIAQEYRKRGIPVVIGGMHATALPEEALEHADSVVVGEAEDIWPELVREFQKTGKLKPIYKSEKLPDLQKLVIPRIDLINPDIYINPTTGEIPIVCLFTTRGCPFNCSFCSVTKFFGRKYRMKPIENIVKEIEHWRGRCSNFFFIDDNLLGNEKYAEELFKALIPLNITWSGQFDTTALKKPKLVELAGKSGCRNILVGFETVDPRNLKTVNKGFNKVDDYKALIKMLIANGISPQATMLVGLDHDDMGVVDRTTDFLLNNGLLYFRVSILTPYPGTEVYSKLENENRIFEKDWSKYDVNHAVFHPKNITAEDLEESVWKIYGKTFSNAGIFKRMWKLRSLYLGKHRKKQSFKFDLSFQFYMQKVTRMGLDPLSDMPVES